MTATLLQFPHGAQTIQDDLRASRVQVSLEAWCAEHRLEPFEVTCDCGALRRTTIPFLNGGSVGLVSPRCTCGSRFGPFEIRALDGTLSMAIQRVPPPRWKKHRRKVISLEKRRIRTKGGA